MTQPDPVPLNDFRVGHFGGVLTILAAYSNGEKRHIQLDLRNEAMIDWLTERISTFATTYPNDFFSIGISDPWGQPHDDLGRGPHHPNYRRDPMYPAASDTTPEPDDGEATP